DSHTFFLKLEGTMTDHTADQKRLSCLLQQKKKDVTVENLGETSILNMTPDELLPLLMKATQNAIDKVGGLEMWNIVSAAEQSVKNEATYHELCQQLGQDEFAHMSLDEQRELIRLIGAGCGTHKDLNTVKG
ncbi:hypothetical protein M422DRAFT_125946, partial [Sphaerobolus stellatus SS14]